MTKLRENITQARDLLGILWYHGAFPLSVVTYSALVAFASGFLVGRFL